MKTQIEFDPSNTKFIKPYALPNVGRYKGSISGNRPRWYGEEGVWETEFGVYVKGIDVPCTITVQTDGVITCETGAQ